MPETFIAIRTLSLQGPLLLVVHSGHLTWQPHNRPN